jgi:hypothetical protein
MRVLSCAALLFILAPCLIAQAFPPATKADSDQDGLSDVLEDTLLAQVQPYFMIHRGDCSQRPAEFVRFEPRPSVRADDGTIYGQVFPHNAKFDEVELHYYHPWSKDCGETPHRLDGRACVCSRKADRCDFVEGSVLVCSRARRYGMRCQPNRRAETLRAEERGAQVWVSAGKHASFLGDTFCRRRSGCGGDRCRTMEPLHIAKIINLGELQTPMNGAVWARSKEWPLSEKLGRSDFPVSRTNPLEGDSAAKIAWANPEKRPIQGAILGANSAVLGAFTATSSTNTALAAASDNTESVLDRACQRTGNSLARSFQSFAKAIQVSAEKTGQALGAK